MILEPNCSCAHENNKGDLQEGILFQQPENLVLVVELRNVNGRLAIHVFEGAAICNSRQSKNAKKKKKDVIAASKASRFNLHSGSVLQQKIHAPLHTIASGVMQRSVLVLVQSIHCSTRLKKYLGTLQLKK